MEILELMPAVFGAICAVMAIWSKRQAAFFLKKRGSNNTIAYLRWKRRTEIATALTLFYVVLTVAIRLLIK